MSIQASDLLLLDTNVLINVTRANKTAERIDAEVGLRQRADRPLVSIVTVGEAMSFARQLNWGPEKVQTLQVLIGELVPVDISSKPVLESYAHFDSLQIQRGWNMKENDLWIAATAAASGAVLITSDKDFDELHEAKLIRRVWIAPHGREPTRG